MADLWKELGDKERGRWDSKADEETPPPPTQL